MGFARAHVAAMAGARSAGASEPMEPQAPTLEEDVAELAFSELRDKRNIREVSYDAAPEKLKAYAVGAAALNFCRVYGF